MIKIAVVDDQASFGDDLERKLREYAEEKDKSFEIFRFQDGLDLIENYNHGYDLIMLDIEMPLLNGMKTAQRIRQVDEKVLIMFITRTAQYAVQGYEVGAVDYILKPYNAYALKMKMDRIMRMLESRVSKYYTINRLDGQHRLPLEDLCYVEVQNHELCYHLRDRQITATGSLRDAEKRLAEDGFARCSNSYLVNLKFVENIRADTVVVNGQTIPISRSKRKDFMAAMMQYEGQ